MNNQPDDLASRLDDLKMVGTGKTAIPSHVLDRVCKYLRLAHAQGALLNVLLTSRSSYEIAAPHLYRDVYITPKGINSLLTGLQLKGHNDAKYLVWPSRYPWDRVPPGEREESLVGVEAYLEGIGGCKVKPDLGIFGKIKLRKYPNETSDARKLALFHRATRIICLGVLDERQLAQLSRLAAASSNLLFPSVDTVVLEDCPVNFSKSRPSTYNTRHVICQAACPKVICTWPLPTWLIPAYIDTGTSLYQPRTQLIDNNPGRARQFNHHGVRFEDLSPRPGATNRFDFAFDLSGLLNGGNRTKTDLFYGRCSQVNILLRRLRDMLPSSPRIDLIDLGRLSFDDNAVVTLATGKEIFKSVLEYEMGQAFYEDEENVLKASEMIRLKLSGDVEECEGCSDLPMAYNPLPKLRSH